MIYFPKIIKIRVKHVFDATLNHSEITTITLRLFF